MRIGGYALIAVEAILTAWMSRIFLTLPGSMAVAIGVAMAILLSMGAKGVKAFLIARYADTPIAARDKLVRWIVVASVLESVLVILLLYIRGSTDGLATRVAIAFGGVSALMSFNTMWLAGAMLACAELYSFSSELAAVWERSDALERQLLVLLGVTEYHMNTIRADERKREGGAPAPRQAGEPRSLFDRRRIAATARATVIGALLITAVTSQGSAQTSCRVWRDDSASPLGADLVATARQIIRAAPQVSLQQCGGTWQVTGFSDDAWSATPIATIRWPLPDMTSCVAPRLNEAEMLFTNARERRLADARNACDSARASAATRFSAAEARATAQLTDALLAVPVRRGACTSVNDLLQRIVGRSAPGVDIIASDMLESCTSRLGRVGSPHGTRVIIVLVSRMVSETRSRSADYQNRRQEILRAAPWAEVVAPWGIADALLRSSEHAGGSNALSSR
jgi:hypothetical protein